MQALKMVCLSLFFLNPKSISTEKSLLKQRLLIAVSGGKDSVSLLHAVNLLIGKLQLRVEVAHVDHRLRDESFRDAKFVEELAKKYTMPFHLKVLGKKPAKENLEAWARN